MPPKSNRHFEKHSSSSSLYFSDYPISLDFNYRAGGKGGGKGEGKGEGGRGNASPPSQQRGCRVPTASLLEGQEEREDGITRDELFNHAHELAFAMDKKGDTE